MQTLHGTFDPVFHRILDIKRAGFLSGLLFSLAGMHFSATTAVIRVKPGTIGMNLPSIIKGCPGLKILENMVFCH